MSCEVAVVPFSEMLASSASEMLSAAEKIIPSAGVGGILMLARILSELGVQYEVMKELKQIKTMSASDGVIHNIEVAIRGPNGRLIGIERTKNGVYQFVADTKGLSKEQLRQQLNFINRIKQKYAYNLVIGELKKQGYVISEEEKVENNTIRLVARKWS